MRKALLFGITGLLTVLFPAAAHASYAPADRQTFQCVTREDCPGPTFVTFNSFTDNPATDAPNHGDERGFFEAKDASTNDAFSDQLTVRNDERVTMRVYIHNDANPTLLGSAGATAHNTFLAVQLPSGNNTSSQPVAYISASNSNPREISDTVGLSATTPFNLSVDSGSPVYMSQRNNGQGDFVNRQLSGVTITNGTNLSVNLGDFPGGFAYHGVVTFTAVVHFAAVQSAVTTTAATTTTSTSTTSTAKPATLPNTGAGDVLGIFSGASALGGAGHYISRRFRR